MRRKASLRSTARRRGGGARWRTGGSGGGVGGVGGGGRARAGPPGLPGRDPFPQRGAGLGGSTGAPGPFHGGAPGPSPGGAPGADPVGAAGPTTLGPASPPPPVGVRVGGPAPPGAHSRGAESTGGAAQS